MSDDFKLYNHFERKFKDAVERCVVFRNLITIIVLRRNFNQLQLLNISYGKEELEADVARLQELNSAMNSSELHIRFLHSKLQNQDGDEHC